MQLADVNVLVAAFREASPGHRVCRNLLLGMTASPLPYAVSDHILSGFLRVATHPRIFAPAASLDQALEFALAYRSQPNAVPIAPGRRHWQIFTDLCRTARPKGNLVPDTYLAALAIEWGCEWVSADRDFSRFADLKWRLIDLP